VIPNKKDIKFIKVTVDRYAPYLKKGKIYKVINDVSRHGFATVMNDGSGQTNLHINKGCVVSRGPRKKTFKAMNDASLPKPPAKKKKVGLSKVFLKVTTPVEGLIVDKTYQALTKVGPNGCNYVIDEAGGLAKLFIGENCTLTKIVTGDLSVGVPHKPISGHPKPIKEKPPSDEAARAKKRQLVDDYFVLDQEVREKQRALDGARDLLRKQAKLVADAFKGQRFVYKGAVWMTAFSRGKTAYHLRCIDVPALEVVG
jgi:hypothetical protein